MIRQLVTALFILSAASSLMAETPALSPTASGIEGTILVSPSRPGPLRKDAPSAAPAGNLEFVVKSGDTRVTTFRTDAEGQFQVAVPPGRYLVVREDPGARIGHWQFEVEVVAGQVAKVTWTGDSGMR
ncbi:MAG: hypothetical protein M3032_03585 [Verrucomicrobiota bacterium]|nr:hypothetical protein [Verrucomicrobiota bacterium]